MNVIKKFIFMAILYMACLHTITAQNPELYRSIPFKSPQNVSIDRFNNLFVTDNKGKISKFDSDGKLLLEYSPVKPGKVTLLEAWQAVKIFVFYQDFQQILFLDRFLAPAPVTNLQEISDGFVRIATISNDNNIWYIDDSGLSLNKYIFSQQKNAIHTPLNLHLNYSDFEFNYLREYQNNLFINDKKNGTFVFDIMGNYLRLIPNPGVNYINFLNDEIYFLDGESLAFVNFYTLNKRNIPLPVSNQVYKLAVATANRLFLISDNRIDIYNY